MLLSRKDKKKRYKKEMVQNAILKHFKRVFALNFIACDDKTLF
jgi:hypothetical protein